MNVASALLKQVLFLRDFESWGYLRKHYLPAEYQTLYSIIDKHSQTYHTLPTIEDLKLSTRDTSTLDKIHLIEKLDVDAEAAMLLEYLKNEYTQKEVLKKLEDFVENSISFESAEEVVQHLHDIILYVNDRVELGDPQQSMQRIELFEDEKTLGRYLPLGLNAEFDSEITFSPIDFIILGGYKGTGKSITCANIGDSVYDSGKSSIIFTIEMDARATLQRGCAIGAGVNYKRLRKRNLTIPEWDKVVKWWGNRFEDSGHAIEEYKDHRDFDRFHRELTTTCQLDRKRQLDIVYDPSLTLGKIQAEIETKLQTEMDIGVIIVDYLNQVKRSNTPSNKGQYDWTEQIEISKSLKSMAQEYQIPVVTPIQTEPGGAIRFAKGITDAADAVYALNAWKKEDECMTFSPLKARNENDEIGFSSFMNWETLKIGPESVLNPDEREQNESKTGEEINDL